MMAFYGFFAVLMSVPVIIGISILICMIVSILVSHSKKLFINDDDIIETYQLPDYEPALVGYLTNYQKIGERELYATIFDLISRNVLIIEKISNNETSEDTFVITNNRVNCNQPLNEFEDYLLWWMYRKGEQYITLDDVGYMINKEKHHQRNFRFFLKKVQNVAKNKDFFSAKNAKVKSFIQSIAKCAITLFEAVKPVIRTLSIFIPVSYCIAVCASLISTLLGENGTINLSDLMIIDNAWITILFLLIPLIELGIIYLLQFLFTYFYNILCYSNELSENGKKEYLKCKGLQKFINTYSQIKEHPIMGITIWKKYYAYSIALKCSDKLFDQLVEMDIVDHSIDIPFIEFFEFAIANIKDSMNKGIKDISTDLHGGAHIDY